MFLLSKRTNSTASEKQQSTTWAQVSIKAQGRSSSTHTDVPRPSDLLSVKQVCKQQCPCISHNCNTKHWCRHIQADLTLTTAAPELPTQRCGAWFGLLDLELLLSLPCTYFLTLWRSGGECLEIGFQILYCYLYMQKTGMKREHVFS